MENKPTDAEILKRHLDETGRPYSWLSVMIGKERAWASKLFERNTRRISSQELKNKIEEVLKEPIFDENTVPLDKLLLEARQKRKAIHRHFEVFIKHIDHSIGLFEKEIQNLDNKPVCQDENKIAHTSINQ